MDWNGAAPAESYEAKGNHLSRTVLSRETAVPSREADRAGA